MVNTYDVNEKVKITGNFSLDGEPSDPAIIRAIYKNPEGIVVTIIFPDARITRISAGIYSFEIITSIPGFWYYRMDDGGQNIAEEGQFQVRINNLS